MKLLSAIILTKNEEVNIEDCIKSLSFCDEIIVIDDNSSDGTINLARRMNAVVYPRELNDDYSAQRNFGLEKANYSWCLFVDADERVSPELKNEILNVTRFKNTNIMGYFIRRKDFIWGKRIDHGEPGNITLLRLARKGAGKWKRIVHEYWDVLGKTETLKSWLYHYPHTTLRDYLQLVNKYTTLHARANYNEHKKSSILKIIFIPKGKFIYNYLIKLGFLDGIQGLIISFMMSFHSFLSWSKLWLIQKRLYQK
ncbi:hypothetical protein A2V55_00060 [Candidatus Woesebacteria bacterium RBG_19FT_COMBO_37_29]|uniref:Glycosyltransferase 2-like domain-containing protein n=1 Tax=Candidatus Woesebacteria bacterium RBG_19FT_COMBO_37_29 TaxID=1802486 RepID=A0A1F7XNG4_9BACT|nr:MAG: hypothetical protein A2V55_00060 [Candidatus Woesebacteria bacterium RBG_19FT_COMBO_37_29]